MQEIKKLKRIDVLDRLEYVQEQTDIITQGITECMFSVPDSIKSPFYIFAHGRKIEHAERCAIFTSGGYSSFEDVPTDRFIWTPRITKPKAEPNSHLFLVRHGGDIVKVIWLLPKKELWDLYEPGKINFNEDIWTSIQNYKNCKEKLESPDPDGPTKKDIEEFRRIYAFEARKKQQLKKTASKVKPIL